VTNKNVLSVFAAIFSFPTQHFHQAGYRQRKDDLLALNDSVAQLQQQLKRAENFVSGLQGAEISPQFSFCCPACLTWPQALLSA
jgi:hypothetical protein